jgi:hypothetical protein
VAFEVGLLLEGAEEEFVVASEDSPIDLREVVAGDVLAVFVEFDRGAALLGAVATREIALDHGLGSELVVLELAEVLGF